MYNPTTPTVEKIRRMNFEGNIIPQSWYANIRTERGKVDLAGCAILADIVYWYRPSEYRDEKTGRVKYYRKFSGERLQRSYEEQGEMLGLTKDQARDAMYRLCDAGLIIITVENGVRFGNGTVGSGVVYIEPVPESIAEITYRIDDFEGQEISLPPQENLPTGVGESTDPYTETTTETNILSPQGERQSSQSDREFASMRSASEGGPPPDLKKGHKKRGIADPIASMSDEERLWGEKIADVLLQPEHFPLETLPRSFVKDCIWQARDLVRDIHASKYSKDRLDSAFTYLLNGGGREYRDGKKNKAYMVTQDIATFILMGDKTKPRSSFSDLPTVDEIRTCDEARMNATQMTFT